MTELAKGKPLRATVDGEKVAIFLVGSDVVAITGRCPHAGGPLHMGTLCGTSLTCPWHGWTYDVLTGACDEDPDLLLPRYAVTVEGDDIFVAL